MWPEIFRIELFGKEFPLRSFGFFVACGFLLGFWMGKRLSFRYGTNPRDDHHAAGDVCWWVLIGAIAGARLGYVVINLGYYTASFGNFLEIFMIWKGGLVMYGGLILALALGYWKVRQHRMNPWQTGDYGLAAGFLGQAVGRLGCFSVGDDYGRATDVPWAIRVPDQQWLTENNSLFGPEIAGQLVHPTQLYMALNAFLLFVIGLVLLPRRKFKGQVFVILLALYAVTRFVIEFYRGDSEARGGWWNLSPEEAVAQGAERHLILSTSQIVGLAALPFLLLFYLWLKRRPDAAAPPPAVPPWKEKQGEAAGAPSA